MVIVFCRVIRVGKLICYCCEVFGGEGVWSNDFGVIIRFLNNIGCVEFCVLSCCIFEGSSFES